MSLLLLVGVTFICLHIRTEETPLFLILSSSFFEDQDVDSLDPAQSC